MEAEIKEIRDRLVKLEVRAEERWKAKETQDKITFSVFDDKLDLLLAHRDTQEHRRVECMDEAKKYTRGYVGMVLGIPTTLILILGVIWGIMRVM